MRVNMTYSIEMDMIPTEIRRIVFAERQSLLGELSNIDENLGDGNYLEAKKNIFVSLEKVEHLKIRLMEVEKMLTSCISILNTDGTFEFNKEEEQENLPFSESEGPQLLEG